MNLVFRGLTTLLISKCLAITYWHKNIKCCLIEGFIEKLGDGVKYNLTKNVYNVFIHEVHTLHSSRLYINSNT